MRMMEAQNVMHLFIPVGLFGLGVELLLYFGRTGKP